MRLYRGFAILTMLVMALACVAPALADDLNDAADGKWTAPTADGVDTWGAGLDVFPVAGDTATIDSNIVTMTNSLLTADNTAPDMITLGTGGTLYRESTSATTIESPLTLSGGTFQSRGRNGHVTISGAVVATTGTTSVLDTDYPSDITRNSITLSGALSGDGDITKEGFNYLYLYETAGYSGTITVNDGFVAMKADATPSATAPTVIVNSGGTFGIKSSGKTVTDWNFILNDGSGLWWQVNANSHDYITGGTAQLTGTVTFTCQSGSNGVGHYDGDMSGSGTLMVAWNQGMLATVALGGDNSGYSGTINVPAPSTLWATSGTALGTGTTVLGGTLGAQFDLTGGYVLVEGGMISNVNNDRTLGAGMTVELTAAGGGLFVSGNTKTFTVDALLTGDGTLTADGSGTGNTMLVTNTANDYAGGTFVNFSPGASGQLVIQEAGALSSGTVQILNNRLVTEPVNPADSVLSGLPAVEARGGILELKSTENNGNIHIYGGGGLIVTDGSTTLDYDTNIFVHTSAILADDLAAFPTAGQIIGGGKIYSGMAADLGSGDTYTVAGAFKGLATLDNNPTVAGTVNEAAGEGISFYRQDSRTMTFDGATLNTTGPVNLDGGGGQGAFVLQGNNFGGTVDTIEMNAGGPLTISGTDGLPSGATLNINNGYGQAGADDAINNGAILNINSGGVWYGNRSLTTGGLNLKAGGALWTDRTDILAVTSIEEGAKIVLAADLASGLPVDGSVDFIVTWREFDAFDQGLVLNENRRIIAAKDAQEARIASPTVISTASTSEIGGRLACGPRTGGNRLNVTAQINFPDKTLLIGDTALYECVDIQGGQDWVGGHLIEGSGMEMISQNESTVWLSNTSNVIGKIWVQGGTMRTDAANTLGGASEVRLDADTVWYTESSTTTTGMIISGEGTLKGKDDGRVFTVQPVVGDDAGLAPGAANHGAGILHLETGRLRFYNTASGEDFIYSKVWIDVVGDGGVAGVDHDQFESAREIMNAENAELEVALPLPGPGLNPTAPNWGTPQLDDYVIGDLGDMTVITASTMAALHGANLAPTIGVDANPATPGIQPDYHWMLKDGATLASYTSTEATVHGGDIVWMGMPGDANLDDSCDVSDLSLLAGSYRKSGNWLKGDFNFDGNVDVSDLSLLAGNFRTSNPYFAPGSGGSPVPEPVSLVLLGLGGLGLVARRRRK